MRALPVLSLILSFLLLAPAAHSQEASPIDERPGAEAARATAEKVQRLFRQWGYKAQIRTLAGGDPLLVSAFEGVKFGVLFYDCQGETCSSIQYRAGFGQPGQIPCKTVNAWNARHRYLAAILNDEGKLFLRLDWDIAQNPKGEVERSFELWRSGVLSLMHRLAGPQQ